jgi:phosphotriesterase-related protein
MRVLGAGAGVGVISTALRGSWDLLAAATQSGAARAQNLQLPKGAIIRTILKDVPPESLGVILFHEHLSLSADYFQKLRAGRGGATAQPSSTPPPPHYSARVDMMVEELRAAHTDGVSCIVDAGHADMGRSLDALKQFSTRSGMPIVASGGHYLPVVYRPELARMSEDEIAAELGRDANAERWGALGEIGSLAEMTPDVRKVFRAVGKAHLQTGLPIFTHTDNGAVALDQLDIFESLGVEPQSVVIGHLGNLNDPQVRVHKAVAKRGAYVGFDRAVRTPELDAQMVPMIRAMIEAGYAGNVVLSSDMGADEKVLKAYGGPGYAKTLTVFVPMLRKAGVNEKTVHTITVDNPRRFLAFVPKRVS